MEVLVIHPQKGNIHLHSTEGQLHDLQALVGGFIETCAPVELRTMGIEMLCNEEGLLKHLDLNDNLYPFFYVGTVVMLGVQGEKFVSLSEGQQIFAMRWLRKLDGLR